MTTIKLDGSGQNMKQLDLIGVLNHDNSSTSPTVARYYDDALNYDEFTGSGLTFDANDVPTGGTIAGATVVESGVVVQKYSGLSLDAVEFYNLASVNDVAGLYAIMLAGNDRIIGTKFSDVLVGGRGNDVMKGANGNDRIYGEAGRDSLTGSGGKDKLIGGGSNDKLDGGRHSDTLIGGAGHDKFVFSTKLGANNVDTVKDFNVAADTIYLENAVFTQTGAEGSDLAAGRFVIGTGAGDANDRIIYDPTTGNLFFDDDGSGADAAVQFAVLSKNLLLTSADFHII